MRLEAPPSRYRVIERGGRLVVIDSLIGGTPPRARDLLRGTADAWEAPAFSDPPPFDDDEGSSAAPPTPVRQPIASRPAPDRSPIAAPPGLPNSVAAAVCNNRRDRDDRLLWTTATWFDAKGPRTVTLSAKAEQQLGVAVLALIAAAVVIVLIAISMTVVGLIVLVVAASVARQAKPGVTAWIDRLARA